MRQSILYQRIESMLIFIVSLYFYIDLDFSILVFVLLLFSFDIFMIGYFFNSKTGAHIYNLGHSMIFPPILLVIGCTADIRALIGLSLIWFAHISLDRALGYGLKFTSSFNDTHLGHIGK